MKKAILYMLLSSLCFTVMNLFVKYLSHFSTPQLLFFRALGSVILSLGYLKSKGIPIVGNRPKWLILRSIVGLASVSLYFAAIDYLPIGTAISLRYTSPIFAAIFAVILLKEKMYKLQWLFFFMAFGGVIIIKGFDIGLNTYGFVLAMLSAFFSGFVYVIITYIGKSEHPVVIINYFMCMVLIFGGVFSLFYWETPKSSEWWFLLSLGGFGYFGQLYMTKAYQIGFTSKIVPLKYMEVVFTVLVGILWFGDQYPILSILGIALVILGLTLNVLYKRKRKL